MERCSWTGGVTKIVRTSKRNGSWQNHSGNWLAASTQVDVHNPWWSQEIQIEIQQKTLKWCSGQHCVQQSKPIDNQADVSIIYEFLKE